MRTNVRNATENIPSVIDNVVCKRWDNNSIESLKLTDYQDKSFSLFLITKAKGVSVVDDISRIISDNQLHFIFSGQKKQWKLEKTPEIDEIIIPDNLFEIYGNYLKYPVSHYMKIGGIDLSEKSFDRFQHEFEHMQEELNNNQLTTGIRLKIIMLMLSKEIYRMHYEKRMDSACILSRFITLVFENFRKERTVKFYADRLAITTNYLNVLCNKHLRKTATGIISNELLSEIKQYLIVSTISIKELSLMMNFSSISSFYAFFKKHTGMTPKDFQNKYKNTNINTMIAEDL